MKKALVIVAAATLLAACGERVQTMGAAVKPGSAAFNGTGKAFVDPGWKQGDKTSWESHLRARGDNSQNEYSRVN